MNVRTTLILACCVLAVGLYVVFVERPWQAEERPAEKPKLVKDLFDPKPGDVKHLEIVRRGKPTLVFDKAKDEDKWRIVEPMKGPAQKWTIDSTLRAVKDLGYVAKYEPGDKDRPTDKQAGLADPTYVVTVVDDKDNTYSLRVGNRRPLSKNTYVQLAGSETIYEAKGGQYPDLQYRDLHDTLKKPLEDYRDKDVVALEATDAVKEAVRVKVEGDKQYELTRADDKWVLEKPVRARAIKTKVDSLVRAIADLRVTEFVEDKAVNLSVYGLDPPRIKVTLTTEHREKAKDEDKEDKEGKEEEEKDEEEKEEKEEEKEKVIKTTVSVLFGGKAGENNYFAALADQQSVFEVSKNTFENAAPKLEDLRDKKVAPFEKDKARRIEIQTAQGPALLEKKDNQWRMEDEAKAELSAVDDLLSDVSGLEAKSFADQQPIIGDTGLAAPRASIAVTAEGEVEPIRVLVGNPTASGEMVYVKNAAEQGIAVVRKEDVEALLQGPLAYRDRSVLQFPRNRATRIELTSADRQFVLSKQAGKWSILEPIEADADKDATDKILADLTSLRAKKVAALGEPAKFGLDKPELIVAITVEEPPKPQPVATQATTAEAGTTQPAATQPTATTVQTTQPAATTMPLATQPTPEPVKKTYRLLVTKKGGAVYAKTDTRELIYELDPKVHTNLTGELHDREFAKFETSEAVGLRIADDKTVHEFRRPEKDKWTYLPDPHVEMDKTKVEKVLNDLRDMRAKRFIDYGAAELAKYGLDAPARTVTVSLEDGRIIELLMAKTGPKDDAGSIYAVARVRPTTTAPVAPTHKVFLLERLQANKLNKKLSDFEKS